MAQKNKNAIAILAGVIILAAAVFLFINSAQNTEQSVSDDAIPVLEDASRIADGAALERGPGAPDGRDAASGRLLAGADSAEQASDEDAGDVAQKKSRKNKKRQPRRQNAESTEADAGETPGNAELPPASIMEGDH